MTHQKPPVTYADCRILQILTALGFKNDEFRQERVALEKIWQSFKEDRIRLVTCDEQMEQDIIIGLNGLGCCVTDAIQMTDNIDEFEKWDKVDREEITQWRQIIDLFEQIGNDYPDEMKFEFDERLQDYRVQSKTKSRA